MRNFLQKYEASEGAVALAGTSASYLSSIPVYEYNQFTISFHIECSAAFSIQIKGAPVDDYGWAVQASTIKSALATTKIITYNISNELNLRFNPFKYLWVNISAATNISMSNIMTYISCIQ